MHSGSTLVSFRLAFLQLHFAMKALCMIFLTLLLVLAVTATKNYKICFRKNNTCQANHNSHKCCRLGGKMAKKGYDCTVETVLATQRYQLSFRQKIHLGSSKRTNALMNKVRRCRRYGACFECCCKHRRKLIAAGVAARVTDRGQNEEGTIL